MKEALSAKNEAHNFEIVLINNGLEFGHGPISGNDEPAVLAQADEIIHNSGEILVPVDKDKNGQVVEDDGCGDGRGVVSIFRLGQTLKRSLNRAKVFGGSVAMAAAALIGVGQAGDKPLNTVFSDAIDTLTDKGMDFGAHTDEQASGEDSGCGAIDKAPEAILAALKYEVPIREVISTLVEDTSQLDAVYANFRTYVGEMPGHGAYSGRQVMDGIIKAGKVIKRLGGGHKERRIIFNTVRGHTVNQQLIRKATGGRSQAFAVDIWRVSDIANNLFEGEPERQAQAYLSELIYTLSTAAVLTNGDLPVYMIQDGPAAAN